jgi:hypothetical protein
VPTPETTTTNKLLATTDACLVRVHAANIGLVVEKEERLMNAFKR